MKNMINLLPEFLLSSKIALITVQYCWDVHSKLVLVSTASLYCFFNETTLEKYQHETSCAVLTCWMPGLLIER